MRTKAGESSGADPLRDRLTDRAIACACNTSVFEDKQVVRCVVVSTALALAVVSSQTVAQDSAARAARDAAIHKCINQAHREVPGGESQDMQRSEAYKACMVSAGFQP